MVWCNSLGSNWLPLKKIPNVYDHFKKKSKNLKLWEKKETTDGVTYYYNEESEIISLENPENTNEVSQEYFWYKHQNYSWIPVKMVEV